MSNNKEFRDTVNEINWAIGSVENLNGGRPFSDIAPEIFNKVALAFEEENTEKLKKLVLYINKRNFSNKTCLIR